MFISSPSAQTDVRRFVVWGALILAVLSLGLTVAYWAHTHNLLLAAAQLTFSLGIMVGVNFIRQRRADWGVAAMSLCVLLTLVLLNVTASGLGPVLILITLVALPPSALQVLPAAHANRVARWSLVTALVLAITTLQPPLLPLVTVDAPALTPYLALAAFGPYAVLVARQYRAYNLRAKLIIAFVLVALAPLGVLTALNNAANRRSLTDAANQTLAAAAAQTAIKIDEYFKNAQNGLRAEAQLPEFKEFLRLSPPERETSPLKKETQDLLEIVKNKDSRIASYMLLDSTGVVVRATNSLDVGRAFTNQDFFRQPFETAQPYLSPVYFFDGALQGSLYLSNQIFVAPNAVGVLVARYNANQVLQEFLETTHGLAGPESFAQLLDENHVRLAHSSDPSLVYKTLAPLDLATLTQLKAASRLPGLPTEALSTDLVDFDNLLYRWVKQPYFSAEAHETARGELDQLAVKPLETRPWVVVFGQPQEAFLAPVNNQTQLAIGLAVLMALIMGLAALGVAQMLSAPIVRLTAIAQRATDGDLTRKAPVESSDEIGALALAFNNMTGRLNELIGSLENRVADRTAQLRAVADIGRATTSLRDLGQLLSLALSLIRDRFGYYHASIFLLDEAGEFAVLRESTGEAGRQLKARRHQLAVGSRSLVGRATQTRQPVVVQDVTHDPTHFRNPLLPDTRAEAVIPLLSGNRLIGALDVQSTVPQAFTEGQVQILQTLADQLSVAIENAELFQRTQASLAEMSNLYQQVTGAGWRSIARGQKQETVYDLTGPGGTQPLARDPVVIPLEVRGQTVGMIELQGRTPASLTPEERAVLEAVRAQLTVALESAALLEETQRRSRREQLINEITYQMRASLDPATILQSGIRELGRALGATEVTVQLAPARPAAPPPTVESKD